MNKKVALAIGLGVVAAIIIIVVSVVTLLGSKTNNIEKEFANVVYNREKFEEYLRKNIDFKYAYAFENCDLIGENLSKEQMEDEFNEVAKNVEKGDLEDFEEDTIDEILSMFDIDTIKEIKLNSTGEKETYKLLPILEYKKVKYDLTRELSKSDKTKDEELEVAFIYYKDKLLGVLPMEYFELELNDDEIYEEDFREENDLDLVEDVPQTLSISSEDIKEFNSPFEKYDDKTIKGSELKEIIDQMIKANEKYAGDGNRFISLETYFLADDAGIELYKTCTEANPYYGGNNTKEKVKLASEEMKKTKDIVEDDNDYEVSLHYGRKLIVELYVDEE